MQQLDFNKTLNLLKKYKIPHCNSVLCKKPDEAVKTAKKLGFPVVLKVSSVDIIHKSDIGAVKTNISNEAEVEKAFEDILKKVKKKKPKAKVQGILVQKEKAGKKIIIGVKKDSQFGHVIMFGLGGIFVEVFKDVSFRIAPIEKETAEEMINEIKSYPILKGIRGEKAVKIPALIDILVKTSKMVMKEEKISELDFNPIIVDEKTAEIIDARIIQE
jgi:acetyl-CoA synthetase (ADP-forming)